MLHKGYGFVKIGSKLIREKIEWDEQTRTGRCQIGRIRKKTINFSVPFLYETLHYRGKDALLIDADKQVVTSFGSVVGFTEEDRLNLHAVTLQKYWDSISRRFLPPMQLMMALGAGAGLLAIFQTIFAQGG